MGNDAYTNIDYSSPNLMIDDQVIKDTLARATPEGKMALLKNLRERRDYGQIPSDKFQEMATPIAEAVSKDTLTLGGQGTQSANRGTAIYNDFMANSGFQQVAPGNVAVKYIARNNDSTGGGDQSANLDNFHDIAKKWDLNDSDIHNALEATLPGNEASNANALSAKDVSDSTLQKMGLSRSDFTYLLTQRDTANKTGQTPIDLTTYFNNLQQGDPHPGPVVGGTPEEFKTFPIIDPTKPGVQQDYETDPHLYDNLKAPITPTQTADPNSIPSFDSLLKSGTPANTSDQMFQDLIGKIGAPSSVDQVQSQVDSQKMQELLDQIDQDTANQKGSLKSDFLDRGLGGPAQISDIEAAGLGDLGAGAVKAKSAARLDYANSELARQKAQEDAVNAAYGAKYNAGVATDTQNKNIAGQGALQQQQLYEDLLKSGNTTEAANTANQNTRDIALAQILQQQEQERLARLAGKYTNPVQPVNNQTGSKNFFDMYGNAIIQGTLNGGAAIIACFDGSTLIKMADGKDKPIKDISLGDETQGGKVQSVRVAITPDGTVYDYLGIKVSGGHAVKENGSWVRVKDAIHATALKGADKVYAIITTLHRIYIGGIVFADECEHDGGQYMDQVESLARLNMEDGQSAKKVRSNSVGV